MIFKHTEETDARIRLGYEAGERVAAIARELKTTRNVVIGRAYRLGLAKPGLPRNYPSGRVMPEAVRETSRANLKELWGREDFRAKMAAAKKAMHADPEIHSRIMSALRTGHARYYANRKANHSTALRLEPAE